MIAVPIKHSEANHALMTRFGNGIKRNPGITFSHKGTNEVGNAQAMGEQAYSELYEPCRHITDRRALVQSNRG